MCGLSLFSCQQLMPDPFGFDSFRLAFNSASSISIESEFSKTPHLVMVHDIKENNFLLSDFENQAPSQIQTSLIEMSPVKLPKSIPCMQMRVGTQFWQINQNLSDSLLLRTRKTPPSF